MAALVVATACRKVHTTQLEGNKRWFLWVVEGNKGSLQALRMLYQGFIVIEVHCLLS